jgi:hypothetical protein
MKGLFLAVALLTCVVSTADAQRAARGGSGSVLGHRGELIPFGGYAWTAGFDVYNGLEPGTLDFEDAAFFGGALDFNVQNMGGKVGQARLLYRRSETKIQYRSKVSLETVERDAALEYYHIGGLAGIPRDNVLPYATFTVGATRLIAGGDDAWKFSSMLGLGVKAYASPKIGFMIQGTWSFTFIDTWGGLAIGTGGTSVAVGGTGISQFDVGGGLIVTF